MISWIQQTFQHHFRTVFAVLLGATIISFVMVIGASPGVGRADRGVESRKFFNVNLASAEEAGRVFNEARLSVEIQYGISGVGGEQLQQYAYNRLAGIAIADQLHVPAPTREELAEAIKKARLFQTKEGAFDAKKYDDFRKSLQKNPNVSESDIAKVIGDNIRAEKVQTLIAGPGYALPADIRQELEAADTAWTLNTLKVDGKSYEPAIKPTEGELAKFFEEKSFLYTIPQRVRVSYVDFAAGDFAGSVKVSEAEVRAFFDANPNRFAPAPEAGKKPDATAKVDYAKVHDDVARAVVFERANALAAKAANAFSLAAYDAKLKPGTEGFASLAKDWKLNVLKVAPFTVDGVPAEFSFNPLAGEEAGKLSPDRAVSDPVQTNRGYAVMFLEEVIPPTPQTLIQVRDKVVADYTAAERQKRFIALGATIRGELQARVKSGESFEKIAPAILESHGLKGEVKSIATFTRRNPPKDLDASVSVKLDGLKAKEVSEMSVNEDQGLIVFAVDRKAPDLTEANPNYAEMRKRIGQSVAYSNAAAYFQDLINREMGVGKAQLVE